MTLNTRVVRAGKVLLITGALLTTYLGFAFVSMRLALRTRDVRVPDLAGHTPAEATAIAGQLDLTVKVDDVRRPDPKLAAGRVLAQDPAAGSTTRRQRSV